MHDNKIPTTVGTNVPVSDLASDKSDNGMDGLYSIATDVLLGMLDSGGVPIPAATVEQHGYLITMHDYNRDDFNGYQAVISDEMSDDRHSVYMVVEEHDGNKPKHVKVLRDSPYTKSPMADNPYHVYVTERFKRPKSVKHLISLDLETLGYNAPLRDGDKFMLGSHIHPIIQLAYIITDEEGKETKRNSLMIDYPEHMVVSSQAVMFHKTTGLWDKYKAADKVSLKEAADTLLKDMEIAAGGPVEDYHYFARNVFVLLGKSLAFDRSFIDFAMPQVGIKLSHQMIDVSIIKPIMREVIPNVRGLSKTVSTHDALDDCISAISEYKALRSIVQLVPDMEGMYVDEILPN